MRKDQFIDKHKYLNIDQAELERKWRVLQELQDQAELQKMWEAAQILSTNAVQATVGGGGGGGTGDSFAAIFGPIEGVGTYPQSATTDADGNIYTLSVAEYEGPTINVLRKISSTGNIIWEIAMMSADEDSVINPNRVRLSPDGYVYIVLTAGIAKFEPETGSLIWSWLNDTTTTDSSMNSLAFLSDGTPVTISNYDAGDGYEANLLCTWHKDIGIKLTEKEFHLGTDSQYVTADICIDEQDNIILPLAYSQLGYGTLIIKWSLGADSEVWRFGIFQADYGNEDQDVTGLGIDQQGNIYANGYGHGLTKFNSSGQLIWAKVTSTYLPGLAVSPDGNCYMYGDPSNDLQVTKISSDGILQWSYLASAEEIDLDNGGWLNSANSMAQWSNGKIYLMGQINGNEFDQELILKVNEQQILGEFGPFIFNQYDESVITVNPTDTGLTAIASDTDYLIGTDGVLIVISQGAELQTIEITNLL